MYQVVSVSNGHLWNVCKIDWDISVNATPAA